MRALAALSLVYVLWAGLGGPAVAVAGPAGQNEGASGGARILTPSQWASAALAPCRAASVRARRADAALGEALSQLPPSRERTTRLEIEQQTRERALERDRAVASARLRALLLGEALEDSIVRLGGEPIAALPDVLSALVRAGDLCILEALEATVVLAIFGEPFAVERLSELRPDRQYGALHRRLRDLVRSGGSLEDGFLRLRPGVEKAAWAYIAALIREMTATPAGTATVDDDETSERWPRQFLTYVSLAAEPVRVQAYLHARIQELEGALGAVVPDRAQHDLHSRAERALCGSAESLVTLREQDPREILQQLEIILDRWFQADALPAIRESLRTDPFGAYWFYVQSGGTADDGPVFRGSQVAPSAMFTLASLRKLGLQEAMRRARSLRVPARFLRAHASLEAAFTNVRLTPTDISTALDRRTSDAGDRRALERFMLDEDEADLTSLDLYGAIVRDASRIEGRLDWDVVDDAAAILALRKRDHLQTAVREAVAAEPPDARLRPYLETASALMIELEQRQAVDQRFQQATAGAVVGWLLSRFFLHGGLPIELWAPGGVTGPEFGALVDLLTPKNERSGNEYTGKAGVRVALVHDGREYHEALCDIIDSAASFLNITSFDWKTDLGGREIALRLMAKKLGLSPAAYGRFLEQFERGRPVGGASDAAVPLWDLTSTRVKDLLVPFSILEFDMRVVLWKGPLEFPWHLGPVPLPGRKIFGIIPMPLIPYPWLNAVPGFGWAGTGTALFLQYLLASDPRVYWGMVAHTKSWSSESTALESGMGMGTKYFNLYAGHKTWHDMGVRVWGDTVNDVNDHFVQVFNQARVNNRGIPSARGVAIPELKYEDYRHPQPLPRRAEPGRTWVLTTHPERGDANYRGVLLAAIAAARRNIYLENSFFSDPVMARLLLKKARELRGRVACDEGMSSYECAERKRNAVEICLVLPDSSDKPIVDAVGTADVHEMLHLGIRIHRWRPGDGWSASRMLHTKAWLIDYEPGGGGLSYVGAANLTQRSHLADNEAGILTTSPAFADELYGRVFEPDVTVDSRIEEGDAFHTSWSSSPTMRSSRWLRRFLVDLLWFI